MCFCRLANWEFDRPSNEQRVVNKSFTYLEGRPLVAHFGLFYSETGFPKRQVPLVLSKRATTRVTRKHKVHVASPYGAVPKIVASRLSLYLRELQGMVRNGRETISSGQLAELLNLTSAQVRRDLAHFGHFGHRGIGYRCRELIPAIRKILGTDQNWPVVLVGAGNLGRALLGYKGFGQQGFHIVAALDVDLSKVHSDIEGIRVEHLDLLPEIVKKHKITIGMIAVPANQAQLVVDRLVSAGIKGIVNFAPVTITLPEWVSQVGVDLAMELEQVSFSVVNRARTD